MYILFVYCINPYRKIRCHYTLLFRQKKEASGLNTKDIYSKIVIFWQMEIKLKINI